MQPRSSNRKHGQVRECNKSTCLEGSLVITVLSDTCNKRMQSMTRDIRAILPIGWAKLDLPIRNFILGNGQTDHQ